MIISLWIAIIALTVPPVLGEPTTEAEKNDCIASHNALRGLHVDTPPLQWDNEIFKKAQAWADNLLASRNFQHEPQGGSGEKLGENLFMRGMQTRATCTEASLGWYNEIKDYNYKTAQSKGGAVGHFTQLVWKASTLFAVGIASGPSRSGGNIDTYIVAKYKPQGNFNMMGQRLQDYSKNVANRTDGTTQVVDAAAIAILMTTVNAGTGQQTTGTEQTTTIAPSLAAATTTITPAVATTSQVGALTPAEKTECISSHNKLRFLHEDTPALIWDDDLAVKAQAWADHLSSTNSFSHQSPSNGLGENLFMKGTQTRASCTAASLGWYNEIEFYDYNTAKTKTGQAVGHFTQLVWKETTHFAVGIASAKRGRNIDTYIVAKYKPRGNFHMSGQYKDDYTKNVKKRKSGGAVPLVVTPEALATIVIPGAEQQTTGTEQTTTVAPALATTSPTTQGDENSVWMTALRVEGPQIKKKLSVEVTESTFKEAFKKCPVVRGLRAVYVRTSDIPDSFNAYSVFAKKWSDQPSNKLKKDFELYDNIDDAVAGRGKWTFCSYGSDGQGFPLDCGKTGSVSGSKYFTLPTSEHSPFVPTDQGLEIYTGENCPSSKGQGTEQQTTDTEQTTTIAPSLDMSITTAAPALATTTTTTEPPTSEGIVQETPAEPSTPEGGEKKEWMTALRLEGPTYNKQLTVKLSESAFNDAFKKCPVVRGFRAVYVRTSPIPPSFNAYNIFAETWSKTPSNTINQDFELYDTIADAVADRGKWTTCNYDLADAGFPSNCGKDTNVYGSLYFTLPGTSHSVRSDQGLEVYTGENCPSSKGQEAEQQTTGTEQTTTVAPTLATTTKTTATTTATTTTTSPTTEEDKPTADGEGETSDSEKTDKGSPSDADDNSSESKSPKKRKASFHRKKTVIKKAKDDDFEVSLKFHVDNPTQRKMYIRPNVYTNDAKGRVHG